MKHDNRVIVITGPTASGKSAAAILLCKHLQGEVICADSMQLYRGMDIGTAKPSKEEQEGIPHHLMDILDPVQTFSVADYKEMATQVIRDVQSRGKTPVLCGGTGLYLSAMIEGVEYAPIKTNPDVRTGIENELKSRGIDSMFEELNRIDPVSASQLHRNDVKRILRALEIFRLTGQTKTKLDEKSKEKGPDFDFISFCITHDRDILYSRINRRVDKMLEEGLLDEIRRLLHDFPTFSNTAYQAIGYKEFIPVLQMETTVTEAASVVKQATRNYAKRQLTWFRKMDSLIWINNQETKEVVETITNIIYNQ